MGSSELFINIKEDTCVIDTFLLSCRVLGLKVEQYMVAYASDIAKRANVNELRGEYIPTSKNQLAADLYPKLGFKETGGTIYSADLQVQQFGVPAHIKTSASAASFLPVA